MPKSTSRKAKRTSRKRRSHAGRSLYRKRAAKSRSSRSDLYHYKETIDGGQIVLPAGGNGRNPGGVWIMRLSDFPIYQRFINCYEFARLNKVTLHYIPRFNMQVNQGTALSTGQGGTQSFGGTLVTAIDQIPLLTSYAGASATVASAVWEGGINDTGVTSPFLAEGGTVITPDYVRGLENSHEKEFYTKQTQTFTPAFYTTLVDTSVINTTSQTAGSTASSSGCYQRNIKKWVNINSIVQTSAGSEAVVSNVGPVYYGPVMALDLRDDEISQTLAVPLFDVRMTYSMSFKRLKGSVANNT